MTDYRFAARCYDTIFEPLNSGLRAIGLKLHPPRSEMAVLDIGCGTGLQLALYQRRGCRVCGIDASAAMLERARSRLGEGAELHLGDATQAPYEDRSFDLVLAMLVLHEISASTRAAVLEQAKRLLVPDGRILVIDFHPGAPGRSLKGWVIRGFILAAEIAGGREHFTNYRDFVASGGIPALATRHQLELEDRRVVAGGNMGIYLMRPGA